MSWRGVFWTVRLIMIGAAAVFYYSRTNSTIISPFDASRTVVDGLSAIVTTLR